MGSQRGFQSATAAAAVALIGAISAVFFWLSYKNSVKTAERQYIMEQKKIDANLKAKARIEWISGVRDKTSELVSLLRYKKEKLFSMSNGWKLKRYLSY